jgi:hypothetical protein
MPKNIIEFNKENDSKKIRFHLSVMRRYNLATVVWLNEIRTTIGTLRQLACQRHELHVHLHIFL